MGRGHLSSSYNPKKVQTFKKILILFTILRRDIEPLGIEACTLSDQLKWYKVQISRSFYSLAINEFSYLLIYDGMKKHFNWCSMAFYRWSSETVRDRNLKLTDVFIWHYGFFNLFIKKNNSMLKTQLFINAS